jgi:BirA family biotin operon repressor/biotin-[acetyl-CoA-carboxylase] ligase
LTNKTRLIDVIGIGVNGVSYFTFKIKKLDSVDSTNSYALSNIDTLAHNTFIYADIQTSGRGRLNREWVSDSSKNLYCSVVIKPEGDYRRLPLVNFTQLFCVIFAEVISSYGVTPQIKWPNDILINGKKVVGILSEVSFSGERFNGIVIGVGMNLASDPSEVLDRNQGVTTLLHECGQTVSREEIIKKAALLYDAYYDLFSETGFSAIRESYLKYFPFIGKEVTIENGITNGPGTVVDVSADGELVIDNGSGQLQNIVLGDMVWESFSRV